MEAAERRWPETTRFDPVPARGVAAVSDGSGFPAERGLTWLGRGGTRGSRAG